MKLSAGIVCQIAGIPRSSLDRWVLFGLVEPENSGSGKGCHRLYSLSQCVAITAAAKYRAQGAAFERIAGIIQFLSSLPIEQLEAELNAGRTIPIPSTILGLDWLPGLMIEPPKCSVKEKSLLKNLDMRTIYADVKRKVSRIDNRPIATRRGRKRVKVKT